MLGVSGRTLPLGDPSARSIQTNMAQATGTTSKPDSQYIYVPKRTQDYVIQRGEKGLGLYANRHIKEGEEIFQNSLQYTITDVEDGDKILFDARKVTTYAQKLKKEAYNVLPISCPVEADLIFTHGIPILSDDDNKHSSGIISYHIKVPAMLLNHSCGANLIHDGGKDGYKRHLAVRDIKVGEELTINYALIYYDEGPIHHKCLCKSPKCCGLVKGFKSLDPEVKEALFKVASPAVRALLLADLKLEKAPKVQQPLIAEREIHAPIFSSSAGFRMITPPPSIKQDGIGISVEKNGEHNLYALRHFEEGDRVYSFWVEDWPMHGKTPVDMVFSTALGIEDPVEGTSFWMDPIEVGYKNAIGRTTFSGFNMLARHSCSPNIRYKQSRNTDRMRWQHAYAASGISKGEDLTIDFNNLFWDRPNIKIATCSCKSDNCAGILKGFKHLSPIQQKKRWVSTDNGRYLSPFIREQCRKKDSYYHEFVCDYDAIDYKEEEESPIEEEDKDDNKDSQNEVVQSSSVMATMKSGITTLGSDDSELDSSSSDDSDDSDEESFEPIPKKYSSRSMNAQIRPPRLPSKKNPSSRSTMTPVRNLQPMPSQQRPTPLRGTSRRASVDTVGSSTLFSEGTFNPINNKSVGRRRSLQPMASERRPTPLRGSSRLASVDTTGASTLFSQGTYSTIHSKEQAPMRALRTHDTIDSIVRKSARNAIAQRDEVSEMTPRALGSNTRDTFSSEDGSETSASQSTKEQNFMGGFNPIQLRNTVGDFVRQSARAIVARRNSAKMKAASGSTTSSTSSGSSSSSDSFAFTPAQRPTFRV